MLKFNWINSLESYFTKWFQTSFPGGPCCPDEGAAAVSGWSDLVRKRSGGDDDFDPFGKPDQIVRRLLSSKLNHCNILIVQTN